MGAICFTSSGSNGGCWVVLVFPPLFFFWKKGFFFPYAICAKKKFKRLTPKKKFLRRKKNAIYAKKKRRVTLISTIELRFPRGQSYPVRRWTRLRDVNTRPQACPIAWLSPCPSFRQVGAAGAQALAALKDAPALCSLHLDLERNQVKASGAQALATLKDAASLAMLHLNLSANQVDPDHAVCRDCVAVAEQKPLHHSLGPTSLRHQALPPELVSLGHGVQAPMAALCCSTRF